ncbi:1-acyl-sn-glycerol-3-phosphate acyltransferase [Treponema sp.]
MDGISSVYKDQIVKMMSYANKDRLITEQNVLQEANKNILPFIDGMVGSLLQEGSGIDGSENLVELMEKAKAGSSCLLLLEHYSNFDLPVFNYLTRKTVEGGDAIADSVIAIAGMKLNEDNPVVSAFAEAYTRIIIYPSRSLMGLDAVKDRAEFIRSIAINRASMKVLNAIKVAGKLILVFPAGTRFRPWDPQSTRGVREIDSYIKSFDYACLVSLNGKILRIQKGDMAEDEICKDLMRVGISPVIKCSEFREKGKSCSRSCSGIEDKKRGCGGYGNGRTRRHAPSRRKEPRKSAR